MTRDREPSTRSYVSQPCLAVVLAIFVVLPSQSKADTIICSDNFESAVGPGWSSNSVSVTPVGGRHFLGEFGNNTVSLSLSDLPAHTSITVSFDLYVIHTWDGNWHSGDQGPDHWKLAVDGGPTLLDTTFSNDHPNSRGDGQAYPENWTSGMTPHPPRTGATEVNTLGYTYMYGTQPGGPMDSVYTLNYTFAHSGTNVTLEYSAWNLQGITDESWGLDNVTVTAIPEPATLSLLALGGLALIRRRRP